MATEQVKPPAAAELESIRERAEAATPDWVNDHHIVYFHANGGGHRLCAVAGQGHSDEQDVADAVFIAHARQDVPALLALIDDLQQIAAIAIRDEQRGYEEMFRRQERAEVAEMLRGMAEFCREKVRASDNKADYQFWADRGVAYENAMGEVLARGPADHLPPYDALQELRKARAALRRIAEMEPAGATLDEDVAEMQRIAREHLGEAP